MLASTWTMVSWTLFSRDLSYLSLSWSSLDSPISHWSPTALPYICAPQVKMQGKVNHLSLFLLQGCWIPILNEYFILHCLLASPDPFYPSLLCWKPASLDYSTVSLTAKKHSSCWTAPPLEWQILLLFTNALSSHPLSSPTLPDLSLALGNFVPGYFTNSPWFLCTHQHLYKWTSLLSYHTWVRDILFLQRPWQYMNTATHTHTQN